MMDAIIGSQAIINLDVDAFLFEKINQLKESGFSVIEINTVDKTLLQKLIKTFPTLRIGAGNIIDTNQLEACYQGGVHFITSPGFILSIAQTANVYSINYLPGVATPSEAMQAFNAGCHHVRPYPATLNFCKLLNKCLPLLRLFPADVNWQDAEKFLNLPSVAAVSILNPAEDEIARLAEGVCA